MVLAFQSNPAREHTGASEVRLDLLICLLDWLIILRSWSTAPSRGHVSLCSYPVMSSPTTNGQSTGSKHTTL